MCPPSPLLLPSSLVLDNAFQNQSTLLGYISRHYIFQMVQEIHKILGSFELLGSPVGRGAPPVSCGAGQH